MPSFDRWCCRKKLNFACLNTRCTIVSTILLRFWVDSLALIHNRSYDAGKSSPKNHDQDTRNKQTSFLLFLLKMPVLQAWVGVEMQNHSPSDLLHACHMPRLKWTKPKLFTMAKATSAIRHPRITGIIGRITSLLLSTMIADIRQWIVSWRSVAGVEMTTSAFRKKWPSSGTKSRTQSLYLYSKELYHLVFILWPHVQNYHWPALTDLAFYRATMNSGKFLSLMPVIL